MPFELTEKTIATIREILKSANPSAHPGISEILRFQSGATGVDSIKVEGVNFVLTLGGRGVWYGYAPPFEIRVSESTTKGDDTWTGTASVETFEFCRAHWGGAYTSTDHKAMFYIRANDRDSAMVQTVLMARLTWAYWASKAPELLAVPFLAPSPAEERLAEAEARLRGALKLLRHVSNGLFMSDARADWTAEEWRRRAERTHTIVCEDLKKLDPYFEWGV